MRFHPILAALRPPAPIAEDIRDIQPPVPIPDPWRWVAWSLAALALGALAYWLWRRSRQRLPASPPPPPPVPPHIRARTALDRALLRIHDPEPFVRDIAAILRRYLEERFELHAPERTTEEFLAELQLSTSLTPAQKETLASFLADADLVKFARLEPAESELRRLHGAAVRLVDETEPASVAAGEIAPAAS